MRARFRSPPFWAWWVLALALGALLLIPGRARAQAFGGVFPSSSGGTCSTAGALASSGAAFAASFRATTATDTGPAYQCDALLTSCVKFGPGVDTGVGANALGEVIFGRTALTSGVWRFWGTVHAVSFSAQSVVLSNFATIPFLLQTSTGYAENQNGVLPWRVNDAHGFQVTCKTALTTCAAANEATVIPICGTGGAVTKQCLCTGDGTTYAWRNLLNPSAGAGTSTTCPAT